jgi:uncharacterized DUF497 family protein
MAIFWGYIKYVRITFDPAKWEWTLKERGLDFADAAKVFAGRHFDRPNDRPDYGEMRMVTAGYLGGRIVVIVWTPRGDARHVISMRQCHEKEASRWRDHLRD